MNRLLFGTLQLQPHENFYFTQGCGNPTSHYVDLPFATQASLAFNLQILSTFLIDPPSLYWGQGSVGNLFYELTSPSNLVSSKGFGLGTS